METLALHTLSCIHTHNGNVDVFRRRCQHHAKEGVWGGFYGQNIFFGLGFDSEAASCCRYNFDLGPALERSSGRNHTSSDSIFTGTDNLEYFGNQYFPAGTVCV